MNSKEHLDRIRELSVKACKKAAEEREKEYNKSPKLCLYCGMPLSYKDHKNKKFCNASCAASYNNKQRAKKLEHTKHCIHCGKEIQKGKESWTNYSNRKYCCFKCYNSHLTEDYIKKWKNGEINGNSPSGGISETVRNYMLEKYEHRCAICGWNKANPFNGHIPLEIHHIDGNSDNNSEDNLIVLCPCCHSLTKNYRGGNSISSSRKKYRKNYKEIPIKLDINAKEEYNRIED